MRSILSWVAVAAASGLGLAGCGSAGRPPRASSPAETPTHTSGTTPATTRAVQPPSIHVAGANPVPAVNDSRATYTDHPGVTGTCTPELLQSDAHRAAIATGLLAVVAPVAAQLLEHFLGGTGTPVRFGPRSSVASAAAGTPQFRQLNHRVLAFLGAHPVSQAGFTIPAGLLAPPDFASPGTDPELRLGFGGMQGVSVTGQVTDTGGRLTGTLAYTLEDSYGFSAEDAASLPYGSTMRQLQTVCGAPEVAGGAHWFPDAITVDVSVGLSATRR